jgi:HNH endonuclease
MSRQTEGGGEELPAPFAYPTEAHHRRHGPAGYTNYQAYKPWLRDEFTFRCVYCFFREAWYPDRQASFSVEHIVPQISAPDHVCDYENMVYSCTACNSAKQDIEVLDPTRTPLGDHLHIREDGSIEALTAEGQDLIDQLGLDCESKTRVRRYYLDVIALKREHPEDPRVHGFFIQAFGYPEPNDLPDLTALRPPGGNARKGSESTSFHKRSAAGTLPPWY